MLDPTVISIWLERAQGVCFGVAAHGDALVATVTARSLEEASRRILGFLPERAPSRFVEDPPVFLREMVLMLARIEQGNEDGKTFTLSPEYVSEPKRSVLRIAAGIPLGFASTYGRVAERAGTNARVVGRIMATNPLYPIVPCHRVVGSDLSLVGYTARRTAAALSAKLGRLQAEARGYAEERSIAAADGLRVVPVEWVVARAAPKPSAAGTQHTLW
jgi:O-6-methylguanine DNA methyltransferase